MAKQKNSKKSVPSTKKSVPKKKIKSNVPDLIIEKGFWQKNTMPALLLFVLSVAVYIQSASYGFVLDDKIVYHENGLVKKGFDGIGEILGTESMVGYFGEQRNLVQGSRYRPLSIVTFAIEHELFGRNNFKVEEYWTKEFANHPDIASRLDNVKADPYLFEDSYPDEESFLNALSGAIPQNIIDANKEEILFHAAYSDAGISHVVNVLLYALLVLLLFRVMNIIFPQINSQWYLTLAFVATLLFALHPVHVEVVANIKGRDEIMALIGALGALYFTLRYIADEKPIHLVGSGVVFLLGLLAKENVLTFMAVIPLTTYFFTKSSFQKNAISLIPLALSMFIFLYMRKEAVDADHIFDFGAGKPSTDLMNNPFVGMSGSEKMATIFYTLGWYVKLLFFPHPLTHDYYPYHVPIMTWSSIGSIVSLILYLGMGAFAVWGLKKKNIIAYGILFFFLPLSVVSNLAISVGTFMNERFLFFSSIGFCIIMGYLIARKLPAPVLNIGLLGLLVVGYAAKTFTRVPVWESAYTLNSSGVEQSPNSARANLYMSTALFKTFYKKEQDPIQKKIYLEEANTYVDKALAIHPAYGSAMTMKVIIATEKYRSDRNVNVLLQDFEKILQARGQRRGRGIDSSIDIYLNHFRTQGSWTNELVQFSHRIGYQFFVEKMNDYPVGMKYIDYGLSLSPSDPQLLQAKARTQQLMGRE